MTTFVVSFDQADLLWERQKVVDLILIGSAMVDKEGNDVTWKVLNFIS